MRCKPVKEKGMEKQREEPMTKEENKDS